MALPTTAEAMRLVADLLSSPSINLHIDKGALLKYLVGTYDQQSQRVHVRMPKEKTTMGMESNEQRFRSFAERYVIARAATFRAGQEDEDGWAAALQAKSLYRKMEAMGRGVTKEDIAMQGPDTPPDPQAQGQMAYSGPVLRGAAGSVVGATAAQLIHPNNIPMPKNNTVNSKNWTG